MPPPPAVGVVEVARKDINPFTDLSGRIEAVDYVEVRPRVAGHITKIHYHEGSEVKAGAMLFSIDARPYRAALARAKAELARATARAELASIEAARGEKLIAANAITAAERDALASASTQATAEVAAAAAAVELARLDVEFTQIRAPVAGRTGRATVSVGDFVSAPALLTSVASVDPVYVYFTGDERTYLRLAGATPGKTEAMPVTVGLADEAGYPHTGRIDFVDNQVDPATGTIRVRAVVANPDKRLAPGLYARVRLAESGTVPALLVDDKAILTDQDRRYVYLVGAGDTVERKDVKLGRVLDGQRVVDEGLAAGDRVIVSGLQKVFPGAKVTIAPAPGATAPGAPGTPAGAAAAAAKPTEAEATGATP